MHNIVAGGGYVVCSECSHELGRGNSTLTRMLIGALTKAQFIVLWRSYVI